MTRLLTKVTLVTVLLLLYNVPASAQTLAAPVGERPDACVECKPYRGVLRCPTYVGVKTNLLFDAVLVPNVGAEVTLCQQLTVAVDWYYTWFKSDSRHRYWQCYGGYLTFRRYLRDRWNPQNDLSGHHVGAYISLLTYDVEWGGRGYQGRKAGLGFGLEYGYGVKLNRTLRLDLVLGMGFQDGEYEEYLPTYDGTGHYVWQSTHKRHWWGPTKAEVSLKWVLGKGGAR